jgi:hypothetical protein
MIIMGTARHLYEISDHLAVYYIFKKKKLRQIILFLNLQESKYYSDGFVLINAKRFLKFKRDILFQEDVFEDRTVDTYLNREISGSSHSYCSRTRMKIE